MRITDIQAHNLSSPIDPPQERHYYGGTRRLLKRDVVLVIAETADGEVGYAPAGASSSAMREYFEGASHSDFATLLEETVAPELAGADLETGDDIYEVIRGLDLPELLESQAVSAIDIAFYDVLGKRQDTPIYELLGEPEDIITTLPLYASGGMYMPPEGYAEQAAAIQDLGFGGYKYRPGLGPEEDLRTIELLRETVGDDMDIMVDAHTWWKMGDRSYGFEQTKQLIEEFAAYDPFWVEEPVEPDDYDGYRDLSTTTTVPIAGGESEESPEGLIDLTEQGQVDYLQGDVRHHRGFTGCWEVIQYCAGRDVTYVPHHFGTHLGLVANAHLTAAGPETELLECPVFGRDESGMYPFDLATDILVDELDIADGQLSIPDGPGLGVEVDLDVIDEYPYIDGPWTEFIYDHDSE